MTESRFIWGHWRLQDWKLNTTELSRLTEEVLDLGLTSIDHADIYGDYSCEAAFGEVLKANPGLRSRMELISKCGIKLISDKFPNRKTKYYDYSKEYIVNQVNQSLKNLKTDYLDTLLLHRPSPFFDAEQVAEAFDILHQSGKVKSFGVSNFLPLEFDQLQQATSFKLSTNQIEISPLCLEHFENQNIPFLQAKKVAPMAWSPLAGGDLFKASDERARRVQQKLSELVEKHGAEGIDQIAFAWLLKHPSGIRPILGTGNKSRIQNALKAQEINLSLEEWFEVYTASTGQDVP